MQLEPVSNIVLRVQPDQFGDCSALQVEKEKLVCELWAYKRTTVLVQSRRVLGQGGSGRSVSLLG